MCGVIGLWDNFADTFLRSLFSAYTLLASPGLWVSRYSLIIFMLPQSMGSIELAAEGRTERASSFTIPWNHRSGVP